MGRSHEEESAVTQKESVIDGALKIFGDAAKKENRLDSDRVLRQALAKIRLMAHAPNDPEVLAALVGELAELCGDDAAAQELVTAFTHHHAAWPGIFRVAGARGKAAAGEGEGSKSARGTAKRDAHELTCAGYGVYFDEANHTVRVLACSDDFDDGGLVGIRGDCSRAYVCRKGDKIDLEEIERTKAANRGPGWMSATDKARKHPIRTH